MQTVGTIQEIWRYPVKSMAGEQISSCSIATLGIPGDRGWALRDEKAGEIRGAKKLPQLMHCQATCLAEPRAGEIPATEITFPDGSRFRAGDKHAETRLSEFLGRPVTLWPIQPKERRDFYRRAASDNPGHGAATREPVEPHDDEPALTRERFSLRALGRELEEFATPLGTFFDGFPLHLVTTASLAELSRLNPAANFDVRRFRPNFIIKSNDNVRGFDETTWARRTLRVGEVRMKIVMPTGRCVMTTLDQKTLPKDPTVLRTIAKHANQNVGVYAIVANGGRINSGDEVVLE